MSSYDPYAAPGRERSTRKYHRELDDARSSDHFLNARGSRELIPRAWEGSELSTEEIQRDFPPPGHYSRRTRSSEPGYYVEEYYEDRRIYARDRSCDRGGRDRESGYGRDYDGRSSHKKAGSVYYEEEERKRAHMLSKQEQIMVAVTGAALAIGSKEIYDRREAHGKKVQRNILASAALGAAGAFAGYQGSELYNQQKAKDEKRSIHLVHKSRDGKLCEYYSDDDEADGGDKKGHKSFLDGALAAAGLGGAVRALTGGDDKSDTRSHAGSRSPSRSRSRGHGGSKIQKAAMASLIAGATEALRVSSQPGTWKGDKAKRILTAAAGAASIDALQNSNKAGSKTGLAEAVIGGLLSNRFVNGPKKTIEEDSRTGRSRSRSRAASRSGGGGSGLAALATAGLGSVIGKKILDSRSDRSRSRARSDSGSCSTSPRRRSRSRSVLDTARRGLARFGFGNSPEKEEVDHNGPRRDRVRNQSRDSQRSARSSKQDDDYSDYAERSKRGEYGHRDRRHDRDQGHSRRGYLYESDLGDSEQGERRAKKMKARNVFQSIETRRARKRRSQKAGSARRRALLQDAASVGIAALGIKGAVSELKEARELEHEVKEFCEQNEKRHQKRVERQQKMRTQKEHGEDSESSTAWSRGRYLKDHSDYDDDDDDKGTQMSFLSRSRYDHLKTSSPATAFLTAPCGQPPDELNRM